MRQLKRLLFAVCIVAGCLFAPAIPAVAEPDGEETLRVKVTPPGGSPVSRTLELTLNKTAIVEFEEDVDDILVANPDIADVLARSKRRIAVMGRGKGESGIIFMGRDGKELLSLDVIVAGQGVTELQTLINRYVPRGDIQAEFVNGSIVLAGKAPSISEADIATQLAQQFVTGTNPVINMISIEGKDQVLLKVRIVEMERSVTKQFGVNLSGSVNFTEVLPDSKGFTFGTQNSFGLSGEALGGLTLGAGYQNIAGGNIQSQAGIALNMLERVGLVRTLAEPNLTALSGENAKFLAGGEFPVPSQANDEGVTLTYKPFGVGLGFTPVVLSEGRISLRISTEVSETTTTGSYTTGGAVVVDSSGQAYAQASIVVPALKVRRADTTVELPSGGSLVIAGLIQEQTRQAMDAVPGVGDLPVLGALFRSREFINNETELVVIVTPYLVDPTDPNNLRAPDDGYLTPKDAKAILFGRLNEVYGVEGADVDPNNAPRGAGFIFD